MYLTRLYRYNKWLFAAIVFFVAMQLLVTYKRGMVISPWYNYGMYSERIYPKQVYEVNAQLTGSKWLYFIAPQLDDKINLTLDNYRKLPGNDTLYNSEIVRLFAKLRLPVPVARFYQSSFSEQNFNEWFSKYYHSFVSVISLPASGKNTPQPAIWNGHELKQN